MTPVNADMVGDQPPLPAAASVAALLEGMRDDQLHARRRPVLPFPTGMDPLDPLLNGGIRAHDLTIIGGPPGIGKTIVTMQWAKSMAIAGNTVIYVCYEHDETDLMTRLFAHELGAVPHHDDLAAVDRLRLSLRAVAGGSRSLAMLLDSEPLAAQAYDRMQAYASRLVFVRGSGRHTDLAALERLVAKYGNGNNVLVVDYLQKVPVFPELGNEAEKVTRVAEGLKDLALNHDITVIAVAAADRPGLETRRIRLHHLRGSSALAYESDLVILMNAKVDAVSKVHLSYDSVRAENFKHYVVFSVEKNRGGPALVDMEFRKDFANYRFEPTGNYVAERMLEEHIFSEA
jgi:replicative DNA helicase